MHRIDADIARLTIKNSAYFRLTSYWKYGLRSDSFHIGQGFVLTVGQLICRMRQCNPTQIKIKIYANHAKSSLAGNLVNKQACLRPRDRFWDIPVPKIDSAFDNLFGKRQTISPLASPLALCARRVSSAASRLLGTTSLRFVLHGWQRLQKLYKYWTGEWIHL